MLADRIGPRVGAPQIVRQGAVGLRGLRVASCPEDITWSTYALLLQHLLRGFLTPWPAIPTFLIFCFPVVFMLPDYVRAEGRWDPVDPCVGCSRLRYIRHNPFGGLTLVWASPFGGRGVHNPCVRTYTHCRVTYMDRHRYHFNWDTVKRGVGCVPCGRERLTSPDNRPN